MSAFQGFLDYLFKLFFFKLYLKHFEGYSVPEHINSICFVVVLFTALSGLI